MNTKFTFRSGRAVRIGLTAILIILCSSITSAKKKPIRVLIIGGGTSHNFKAWNATADSALLVKDGFATVKYVGSAVTNGQVPFATGSPETAQILSALPQTDVLYITTNNQFNDPSLRQAIMDFVNSGKGIVFGHASGWYNYNSKQPRGAAPDPSWVSWTDYNTKFINGGTRGHDRLGNYDVTITNTKHQITQGITRTTFPVRDELYNAIADTSRAAPGWQVLATATSPVTSKVFPQLWITNSKKGRLVNLTLGHDGGSHDVPEYQTLLRNSIAWVKKQKNPK